jgi:hypothetical protein
MLKKIGLPCPAYASTLFLLASVFFVRLYFKARPPIIMAKYTLREQRRPPRVPPALVVILYVGSSMGLFFVIASVLKNQQ